MEITCKCSICGCNVILYASALIDEIGDIVLNVSPCEECIKKLNNNELGNLIKTAISKNIIEDIIDECDYLTSPDLSIAHKGIWVKKDDLIKKLGLSN